MVFSASGGRSGSPIDALSTSAYSRHLPSARTNDDEKLSCESKQVGIIHHWIQNHGPKRGSNAKMKTSMMERVDCVIEGENVGEERIAAAHGAA